MVAVKRLVPSEAVPAKKSQEQKPLEEEDFPRGGGGGLSALQRRELREEGAAEAAREFAAEGGPRKRHKREVWALGLPGLYSIAVFYVVAISTAQAV